MIVDIIKSVVDKMKVFNTVSIVNDGHGINYNVDIPTGPLAIRLNQSYGDIRSDFSPPTPIRLNGGSCDDEEVLGVSVWWDGVTTYFQSSPVTTCINYTSVNTNFDDTKLGQYSVTINTSDVQYWHVGARMGFKDGGIYYYGSVTAINSNVLTVVLDNLDNLSSITEFIMDINYKYGHPKDVFNEISKMAQHPDYKARRFPVIALLQDFDEELNAGIDEVPVQLILGLDTQPHFNTKQRYDASFTERKLLLLYKRFIQYLEWDTSTYFRRGDATKTDRMYWGKDGALGNEENKADEFIDAIEININLKVLSTC